MLRQFLAEGGLNLDGVEYVMILQDMTQKRGCLYAKETWSLRYDAVPIRGICPYIEGIIIS